MPEEDFGGVLGFGASGSAGGEPILGANDLLKAAASINESVTKLTQVYQSASNPHTLGQSSNVSGPGGLPAPPQAPQQSGFQSWINSAFVANTPYTSASSPLSSSQPASGGQGSGAGFAGTVQQSMGGGGYQQQQTANGGGEGGTGSVSMGGASIPMPSSNTPAGKMAGGFAAITSAAFNAGSQQMPGQFALSNLSQQAGLMGTSQAQARAGAVGKGNSNLNTQALNAGDASSGQALLAQLSGTTNFGRKSGLSGGELRNTMGAANSIAYANPGIGYSKAASAVAGLYTPQGAYQLQNVGDVAGNPLGRNGQTRNFATVAQGIMQTFLGSKKMSSQALAQKSKLGYNFSNQIDSMFGQQNGQAIIGAVQAENNVASKSNMNPKQIQQLFNQAARPANNSQGQAARSELQKRFSVNDTDIQHVTQANSVKSGRQNEIYGPFTKGLADATGALSNFNQKINSLLNGPLGKAVGYSQGFGGGLESLSSPGNLLSTIGGGLGLAKGASLFGKLFGKTGLGSKAGDAVDDAKGKLGDLFKGAKGAGGDAAGDAGGAAGDAGAGVSTGAKGLADLGGDAAGGMATGGIAIGGQLAQMIGGKMIQKLFGQKGKKGNVGNLLQDMLTKDPTSFGSDPMSWVKSIGSNIGSLFGGAAPKNQKGKSKSSPTNSGNNSGGPSSQAAAAVTNAESQLGVPYVWGGNTPGKGFDCSGLTSWAYDKAGVTIPRTSGAQFDFLKGKNRLIDLKNVEEGDLIFANGVGDGGTFNNPGHVAMMVSGNKLIQAPFTGEDVSYLNYDPGDWTHAGRPAGSTKGGGGGGSNGNSGSPSTTTQGGGPGGLGLNVGQYGSSNETDVINQGLLAQAGGGGVSDTTSTNTPSNGGSSPTGGDVSGNSNGAKIYNYLMDNIFSHKKIPSAGAIASMWGESTYKGVPWNPEAVGDGGGGIMGWTGPPKGLVTGDPSKDLTAQLNYIPKWLRSNGDYGSRLDAVEKSSTVLAAANNWGQLIERFGSNDVHSGGIAAAKSIAGLAAGSDSADPGWTWVGERGPELMLAKGGEKLVRAAEAAAAVGVAEVPTVMSKQGKSLMGATSGGASVHVAKGGIIINNNGGWNGKTEKEATEEMLETVCEHLDAADVEKAISLGKKSS